ncbi:hypothetical protein BLX41_18250 [Pseudomonas protegens]|uniref:hypothetical protein n=1 Tax=Pseudomonas protegens TaxID=380021 RepID=UPI000F4CF154|nr:hypothetical protein [Pseudomonas protegens]ROL72987.1 hypothetical protein BLX41_18250 [Pseudomonas protegens]
MKMKDFRILIADPNFKHQMHIERSLNQLGYYRITTATTHEETLKLTRVESCQIDVLIIAKELPASTQDSKSYGSNNGSFNARYILRYPSVESGIKDTRCSSKKVSITTELPGALSLYLFMQSVELMDINSPAGVLGYTEVHPQHLLITDSES